MVFRNLTTSKKRTGCQGSQGSPRAVAPSEEEEEEEEEEFLTYCKWTLSLKRSV
jgi:hypothetical protein